MAVFAREAGNSGIDPESIRTSGVHAMRYAAAPLSAILRVLQQFSTIEIAITDR